MTDKEKVASKRREQEIWLMVLILPGLGDGHWLPWGLPSLMEGSFLPGLSQIFQIEPHTGVPLMAQGRLRCRRARGMVRKMIKETKAENCQMGQEPKISRQHFTLEKQRVRENSQPHNKLYLQPLCARHFVRCWGEHGELVRQ